MENSKQKKEVLLKDFREEQRTIVLKKKPIEINDLLKKAALYILIGFAFIGCMFLIFGGKDDKGKETAIFNDVIPQASGGEMQSDKQKAYEKELLQKRAEEKKHALITLSDYWQNDTAISENLNESKSSHLENTQENYKQDRVPPSAKGYQSIRNTLDNFYAPDDENKKLREQLKALQEKELNQESQRNPMEDQLELMEKSFQMASKYLPTAVKSEQKADSIPKEEEDKLLQPVYSEYKSVVSSLYRIPEYAQNDMENLFHTATSHDEKQIMKSSIGAVIHQTQVIRIGGSVKVRLTEPMRIEGITIPRGEILTALVKYESGRVYLMINSIEYRQRIFQVEMNAYDMDGQKGLYLPNSAEMNALREIFSGLGNSTGTSITMNNSAADQLTADLTKGVVKGVSGYLSGKNQMPKITFKAGHELLLVSKK